MKNLLTFASLCAFLLVAPLAAHADTLNGADGFALDNVAPTPGGSSLDPGHSLTSLSWTGGNTTSNGTGNLAIPAGTAISAGTLFPNGVDGGNGSPFTIDFVGFGTFTETGNPLIVANTSSGGSSSGLELFLIGTFTPSGALAGDDSGTASLDISFTETLGAYSGGGTFATPAAAPPSIIPEPASLALLGTGILGGLGFIRRRAA